MQLSCLTEKRAPHTIPRTRRLEKLRLSCSRTRYVGFDGGLQPGWASSARGLRGPGIGTFKPLTPPKTRTIRPFGFSYRSIVVDNGRGHKAEKCFSLRVSWTEASDGAWTHFTQYPNSLHPLHSLVPLIFFIPKPLSKYGRALAMAS
jgi:hypothetical protein